MSGWRPSGPKFPRGKLNPHDEGAIRFAARVEGNTLIIDFGKPVAWLGLGLHEVTAMREAFEKYEKQLREKSA